MSEIISTAYTNSGSRSINEDAYCAQENLYIVCDGVGGRAYGEVASKLACSSISDYFKSNSTKIYEDNYLSKALQYTIEQFQETENKYPELKKMATTLVLIAFDSIGANIAWLGDSRLYHIRNGQILFVTEDHSLVNDLRKQGETNESKLTGIRNFITNSLSANNKGNFSFYRINNTGIQKGDYFFLCTDGVLENITDEILCTELSSKNTLKEKAQNIFSFCEGKTGDNFTFQIIQA
ncbi:MAG: protein phosphatase 2C domain-containing protein [Bacteroidetes bacterium]|nr:protein phosphatase 2C domain-containing protein [Bacteroidota bacterium]